MNYETFQISEISLDQYNPRFPPVLSQEAAMYAMLNEQEEKLLTLAKDITIYGLDPSRFFVVFYEQGKLVSGDGNRRLTALKILANPSLIKSHRLYKRFCEISNENSLSFDKVNCIVFENRKDAEHWIEVNHGGQLEGRGQVAWSSEQKERFSGRKSLALRVKDFLISQGLMSELDFVPIQQTTLNRILGTSYAKKRLGIVIEKGESISADWESVIKICNGLKGVHVSSVYNVDLITQFIDKVLGSSQMELNSDSVERAPDTISHGSSGKDSCSVKNNESIAKKRRTPRISKEDFVFFGKALYLRASEANNLYRDILSLWEFYRESSAVSQNFIALIRMSLRLLCETAARECDMRERPVESYVREYFKNAKDGLSKNHKRLLHLHALDGNDAVGRITSLLQNSAHSYAESKGEELTVVIAIAVGAMLQISHGKN